ncbi:hypothetical protein GCM10027592_25670 [Spirosoma flavus]
MKSLRIFLIMSVLSGSTYVSYGQRIEPDPGTDLAIETARKWAVKFSLLSLLDPDNTIQFGVERMLNRRQSLQLETGYGWQGMNLWENSRNGRYRDREVWRGRLEWRYFFNPTGQPRGRYVAVEGFYKQVNLRESGTVGIGCATGMCQYYQLFTAPLQKYVWGAHVKIGRQFQFIPTNNHWLFDVYLGLGFRRRIVESYRPAADTYYYRSTGINLFDTFNATPATLFSMSYGFKLGFAL